jgi:hypothetical protein
MERASSFQVSFPAVNSRHAAMMRRPSMLEISYLFLKGPRVRIDPVVQLYFI